MTPEETLEEARHRLACKYDQPYIIRAILAGEWDGGSLMRFEMNKLEAEAIARMPEEIPE